MKSYKQPEGEWFWIEMIRNESTASVQNSTMGKIPRSGMIVKMMFQFVSEEGVMNESNHPARGLAEISMQYR